MLGGQPEQGFEGNMAVEAAIVAKNEFIEISVDVLAAQAVIRAEAPSLHPSRWSYRGRQHDARGKRGNNGAGSASDIKRLITRLRPRGLHRQEFALRGGVNLLMYPLTRNIKSDQVHVRDLLERLAH
jgi:hypothetical protein